MRKTHSEIQQKVTELYEYLAKDDSGSLIVPVNLSPLLEKFNLKAFNVTFNRPDIAGAFSRKEKTVYVNKTDPQTRKIFTIAHELGHYFLHNNVSTDILYREQTINGRKPSIETEADLFAAELLMPESVIRFYWPVAESIQQLADVFAVSYSAMLNRLRYLGFI